MIALSYRSLFSVLVLLLFVLAGRYTITWVHQAEKSKPNDVLAVGLIDDTPPYCFYNEENKLVGFNIDLVEEIGRRIGKKPHIESVSFNRLTSGLMTRQYDMVILGSITPQRARVVRYARPHLVSADVLLVHPKLADVKSIRQFKGNPWRIGVYNGTSYIQLLKELGLERNMVIYPNQRDVFLAFYKHRVDAIIMNEDVASYIKLHLDPTIVIAPDKLRTDRRYAFALRKEDLPLWNEVSRTIDALVADGTLSQMRERWLLQPNDGRNS